MARAGLGEQRYPHSHKYMQERCDLRYAAKKQLVQEFLLDFLAPSAFVRSHRRPPVSKNHAYCFAEDSSAVEIATPGSSPELVALHKAARCYSHQRRNSAKVANAFLVNAVAETDL